jgi:hypothetical protein
MDMEKILAVFEQYGAGYLFYLLDLFRPLGSRETIALSRQDARLLVFSLLRAVIGSVLYASAISEKFDQISLASAHVVVAASIFWGVLALIAHLIIARSRKIDFVETLSAILRVVPGAFALAAAAAFAVRHFSFFWDNDSRRWLAAFAFLGSQLALLAMALPASLARLEGADKPRRRAAVSAVIFSVFLLNFLTVYMGGSSAHAQTRTSDPSSADLPQNPPWWCLASLPCPHTPGPPTGRHGIPAPPRSGGEPAYAPDEGAAPTDGAEVPDAEQVPPPFEASRRDGAASTTDTEAGHVGSMEVSPPSPTAPSLQQ